MIEMKIKILLFQMILEILTPIPSEDYLEKERKEFEIIFYKNNHFNRIMVILQGWKLYK